MFQFNTFDAFTQQMAAMVGCVFLLNKLETIIEVNAGKTSSKEQDLCKVLTSTMGIQALPDKQFR